ncbi:MAG: primosomal protein N' [Candidatus Promineifilaceae bacterium]|nr:primosomal protein N' [Candidatus Promineifilaceae bacterium]
MINIEAGLESTFHYHIPTDLEARLQVGHLVEVEFGRRLAQGIVVGFDSVAAVADTKPIISIIDPRPVLWPWQIALARWLSERYLAPLNACIRLLLPPGLSRWADITVAINRYWDGEGRLTDIQQLIVELLREKGDLRGRELRRALPKGYRKKWQTAVNQLVRRDILIKGTVLDPPRVKPKRVRTAELVAGPRQIWDAAVNLGRASNAADVLYYLVQSGDPLPAEEEVRAATNAGDDHLESLIAGGLVARTPASRLVVPNGDPDALEPKLQEQYERLPATAEQLDAPLLEQLEASGAVHIVAQPAALNLAVSRAEALEQIFRLRNGERYLEIINLLAMEAQPVELSDIYAATDSTIYHLRRLEEQELIRFGTEHVWRDPLADRDFVPREAPELTADQKKVWQTIKMAMVAEDEARAQNGPSDGEKPVDDGEAGDGSDEKTKAFLLHGVTGSGKTEIYMKAIELALARGQQAVVLVPEIALTPQTVRRFAARFPGRVAVLHSRLTAGERYDTWRRARQGLFDIIVGPRSALFTPFPNLGVVVVDEEHDHSYKQTPPVPPPYYHARETAVALGQLLGATVIMGSATPDLVTYHRARSGGYRLLELPRRVLGHRDRIHTQADRLQVEALYQHDEADPEETMSIPLPPVQVVDLRQELRAGNRSIFSRALQKGVDEVLARGEQAILFLNRRGTATFIMCRDCGLVVKCPRCDVPLTYHRPHMALMCHHCGRKEPAPRECPECNSKRIKYFGLGTEELEALVQKRWPAARTVRWDSDTTAGRDMHEQLLASFVRHEADILIGTQMIAKGLDLPLVTLVGVISADVSLGLPDFHTGERTFQLLTQVSGRAGRGLLGGRVIVQTYKPEHYAIQAAAEHDYTSFYLEEIRFRTRHSYPPFRRLARLLIVDPVEKRARQEAETLARALRLHIHEKGLNATELIGPAPPFFNRIDGRYRWQILVRSPDPRRLLDDFPVPRPWIVDVDPVSTL